MDTISILWLFDDRWVFGITPFMQEYTIAIPCALNIVLLSVAAAYKSSYGCGYGYELVDIIICSSILILLELALFCWIFAARIHKARRFGTVTLNKEAAWKFISRFNLKKIAWSWLSFFTSLTSIVLLGLSHKYLDISQCQNTIIPIWFYLNVVFWGIIVAVFCMFWCSWKFPRCYLSQRRILE